MLILALLTNGCLINEAAYLKRLAELTDSDGDGYAAEDDCDDANIAVHPDAVEMCDGADEDCDGAIDDNADDVAAWFADNDGDGHGDAGGREWACEAPHDFVASEDDCDDGDAAVFPGATEIPYNGIDDDCSDGDADDLDGDGQAGAAAGGADCDDDDAAAFEGADETWSDGFTDNDCDGEHEAISLEFGSEAFYLPKTGAQFGRRVAAAGDIDGDGRSELLVGAPADGTAFVNGGSVWLITGTAGGDAGAYPTIPAGGESWYLGTTVGAAHDADGDGTLDPLVAATGFSNGRGRVFGVSGAALLAGDAALPDDAVWSVTGDAEFGFAGSGAKDVGDVDGDGLDDIVVGAPYVGTEALAANGAVARFSGASLTGDVTFADADATWTGYYSGEIVGQTIIELGDQDGDGTPEIGLLGYDGVPLVVLSGAAPSGSVDTVAVSLFTDDGANTTASDVGDIDGDGRRDIALAASELFLFVDIAGSPINTTSAAYARLDTGGEWIGAVVTPGDIDGDGRGEMAVTLPYSTALGTSWMGLVEGSAWSFGAELLVADLPLTAVSTRPTSGFGYRAAAVGELDGDGTLWLALGGWDDDSGGTDAGAVAVIPVPK